MQVRHRLPSRRAAQIGMDHLAHDRARPDDRDLAPRRRKNAPASSAAASPSARGSRSGTRRSCRRFCIIVVDVAASSCGRCARSISTPRSAQSSSVSCSTAIMPRPEQVDFDDAEVLAVVLVPLHDDAARHRRLLQRHDRVELALADDHAAGVLAEMPRQVLDRVVERDEGRMRGSPSVEARLLELALERVHRCRGNSPAAHEAAKSGRSIGSSKSSALPISRAALRPR